MDEVEDIKNRINIVDFIGQYLTLKKAGSNYKALCPFHDERTPSFMVSPEKQIFKCFGCGKGGDVIEFLMEKENLQFREALELLAQRTGVSLRRKSEILISKSETISKSQLFQINMAAAQLWHKILMTHPVAKAALQYLRGRKISDSTMKQFLIGYAPTQETTRAYLTKRGFSPEAIRLAGSPDKFFKRIMFPLFDVIGNIPAFTGRASQSYQEPKYLNTPETNLFHKSRYIYGLNFAKPAMKKLDQVIVVEGQMDVVASHQALVTNVVATSGTALTGDHLTILSRYTPNLLLAFDNDQAGVRATKQATELALDLELTVKVLSLPTGFKDIGELVEKDPTKWQQVATGSKPWFDWLLDNYHPPASIEQKKRLAKEVLPFLARVKDPIEQAHWIKKLASMLMVKEQAVAEALDKLKVKGLPAGLQPSIAKQPMSLEQELYGLLLANPQFQKTNPKIYQELKNWYNKDTKQLILMIEQSYQGVTTADIEQAILHLKQRIYQRKADQLKAAFAQKIAQAESQGDRQAVKKLFLQLSYALKEKSKISQSADQPAG